MERKPGAGAIVIAPTWDSCGTHEVVKGQIGTLSLLGFETYLLAAPTRWMEREEYEPYRRQYRQQTADIACTWRGEAKLPLLRRRLQHFRAGAEGRSAAHKAIEVASVMRLPRSLTWFAWRRTELFILCNHYFNMPFVAALQRQLRRKLKTVLETHDVQSRHLRQREGPDTDEAYAAMLADEMAVCATADRLVHINADEHAVFAAALPGHAHQLVYPALPERVAPTAERCATTFLIVAAPNIPNAASVNWFLNEVWSRYTGNGTLRIVGGVNVLMGWLHPEAYRRWHGLFAGRVETLAAEYAAAAVVLVPVIAGEGLSIKFAEAVSFGKPVLFTPRAVRGLPPASVDLVRDGCCADADAFLAKLAEVPADAAVTASAASLRLYRALFAPAAHAMAYHGIVRDLTNRIGPG